MFEADLKIECKNPNLVKRSLEPDIKNDDGIKTVMKAGKGHIDIKIKSKKLNHLKAVINTYMSLISMLDEIDTIE